MKALEIAAFAWLIIDGTNYGSVVTASGVYPDGAGDSWPGSVTPTYYLYTKEGLECTGLPEFNGRDSLVKIDGHVMWSASVRYSERKNAWVITTREGSVDCLRVKPENLRDHEMAPLSYRHPGSA